MSIEIYKRVFPVCPKMRRGKEQGDNFTDLTAAEVGFPVATGITHFVSRCSRDLSVWSETAAKGVVR